VTTVFAATPLWTDKLLVGITAIGVLGGVLALWLSLQQLKLQTQELKSQTAQEREAIDIRMAQRALELMRMLADLGRVVVEHPELAAYFGTGKEPPPADNSELRSRVLAHASGYMSLAEATGWQRHVGQLSDEASDAWRKYFTDLHDTTPAIQQVLQENAALLADETLGLFGVTRQEVARLPMQRPQGRQARG
jgi:hypothetical protein